MPTLKDKIVYLGEVLALRRTRYSLVMEHTTKSKSDSANPITLYFYTAMQPISIPATTNAKSRIWMRAKPIAKDRYTLDLIAESESKAIAPGFRYKRQIIPLVTKKHPLSEEGIRTVMSAAATQLLGGNGYTRFGVSQPFTGKELDLEALTLPPAATLDSWIEKAMPLVP